MIQIVAALFGLAIVAFICFLWMWIPFSPHNTILVGYPAESVLLPFMASAFVFRYFDIALMLLPVRAVFPFDDNKFRQFGGYMRVYQNVGITDAEHKEIVSNLFWARLFAILPYAFLFLTVAFTFYVCIALLGLSKFATPLFIEEGRVGIFSLLFFTIQETANVLTFGALDAYGARFSGLTPNTDCLILSHLLFTFRLFIAASAGSAIYYWVRYWMILYDAPDERSLFFEAYKEMLDQNAPVGPTPAPQSA